MAAASSYHTDTAERDPLIRPSSGYSPAASSSSSSFTLVTGLSTSRFATLAMRTSLRHSTPPATARPHKAHSSCIRRWLYKIVFYTLRCLVGKVQDVINCVRYNFSEPSVLRNLKTRILTQLALSLVEAIITYSDISLAMWTYCGTPIHETPELDANCVFEKNKWVWVNLGFAAIIFVITFLLRWYRIKYDMLPLCDLVDDTKQKRELVEQMLHDIQESTLLLCDPASASSKEAFLAVLAEAQEKLNRIQDIIHSFDPRHLDEPESRIAKYSYLIKWIHLLLHALCVFPLGASVYYLCRLTTTFLTENPNWETNRWDIVWSALFGALQVLSVRTFIEGIETRASQLYTAEMERLGQTILTLFQMPVLILATRAIFLTGDDGIYRGGHTHLIAQVLERMQLSLRAHRASPTHPRIFHIQEDSESSDSEEASSVDVTPPASPVLQSPLREAAKRSRDASLPTVDPVQVHLNQNVLTFFQQMERYRASLASHGVPDIFTHQVDDHPNGYREL